MIAAMDRMVESEELLTKLSAQFRGLEGREMDSLRRQTTTLQDSIRSIREFISGKVSDRQGLSRPQQVTVLNTIQTAQQYIMAKSVAPGRQEEALVQNAEIMVNTAVGRVNRFYETAWAAYRKGVEASRLQLFRDYPTIQ